jgi:hypothetical protein
MSTVSKECIFEAGGNTYTINKPDIGQLLDIQTMKAQITRGNYGQIVRNLDEVGVMSLDIVDMIAVLSSLCPEVITDLKVDNWSKLDPFDILDLYKGYHETVHPWYSKYSKDLTKVWSSITDSLIEKKDDKS